MPNMYTAGTCSTGLRAFYPGSRLLYVIELGSLTPLGGVLTITTCNHSANNTVLYVGTGCPTWALPFGCLAGNDNAGDAGVGSVVTTACAANPRASSIIVPGVLSRTLHIQIGGYGGAPIVSGLAWSYAPVASRSATAPVTRRTTDTRSATRSRTRPRTASSSGTRTGSAMGSRSRTRKAK